MRRHFTQEDKWQATKHMKRCPTSLAIREMQIKTTMRCHSILTRMAKNKNSDNAKFRQGCRKAGFLTCCWWKCKMIQSLWEKVWQFLKPYVLAITLLGNVSQRTENRGPHETCVVIVPSSSIYHSQELGTANRPAVGG